MITVDLCSILLLFPLIIYTFFPVVSRFIHLLNIYFPRACGAVSVEGEEREGKKVIETIFKKSETHYNIKMVVLKIRGCSAHRTLTRVPFLWLLLLLVLNTLHRDKMYDSECRKHSFEHILCGRTWFTCSCCCFVYFLPLTGRLAEIDHFHFQFSLYWIWFAELFYNLVSFLWNCYSIVQ